MFTQNTSAFSNSIYIHILAFHHDEAQLVYLISHELSHIISFSVNLFMLSFILSRVHFIITLEVALP